MLKNKFERLLKNGILTEKELDENIRESAAAGRLLEEWLIERGVPKHEILFSLTEFYSCPFVEYDESVIASFFLTRRLNMEKLKRNLWFPLAVSKGRAEVIACHPFDPDVMEDVEATLGVREVNFIVALPSDLIRIIEHNFDVNPHFPFSAGRTPLAKVRTFLADRRSLMTCTRTSLAKGRTGLAFIRTGMAFMAIAVVLFRVFGMGLSVFFEGALFISGILMIYDGLLWYIPARKTGRRVFDFTATEPTWGTTVLKMTDPGDDPLFTRTGHVEGAALLRSRWNNLSPVMRRRFFSSDRTDFAEERTTHVCLWTTMARARTGLAFARTGIVFIGFGIALLRQFRPGPWTFFDAALVAVGLAMAAEGFYWYFPGRRAGSMSFKSVRKSEGKQNIWDLAFPHALKQPGSDYKCVLNVRPSSEPGIWATTGLALERTMLADRRNVMLRLRTVMTRSRTGLALVRTGVGVSAVGTELLVYFGAGNIAWTIFNILLIVVGLALIADGFYWHIPAEKIRKQYPYCYGDMELIIPDYGKPARLWKKVVFRTDESG